MTESPFSSLMGRDMAVDLGTANTLVYVRGRGIVLNEPSVVAINVKDGRLLAVGTEAKRMIGRTPAHIQAIRPLKDGVIADFEMCEKMLRYFIHKVHQRRFGQAPHGHLRAVGHHGRRAARRAGGGRVRGRPQAGPHHRGAHGRGHRRRPPGARADRQHDRRHRRRHHRGGGDLARRHRASQSVRVGGDELDEAIIQFIKKEYSLALGERTAEEVKIALGSGLAAPGGAARRDPRPRPRDRSPQDHRHEHRGDPRGHRGAGRRGRRRGEEHPRQDAAGAGRRHHGEGHHAGRWGRAAPRPQRPAPARDRHAHHHRPQPPALRRHRLGSVAGGDRCQGRRHVRLAGRQLAAPRQCLPPGAAVAVASR